MKKSDYNRPITIKPPVDPKNVNHYVNNQEFHAALTQYLAERKEAVDQSKELPRIPEYIGECFMKIARGVAQKHNFRNYSYINDMVSNAVLTCVKNVACFDPSRGTSAFAYFTQCVWFCFLGEFNREKKEMMKKREIFLSGNFDSFDVSEEDADYVMQYNDYLRSMSSESSQPKKEEKIKKKKKGAIDTFFSGDEVEC